MQLKIKNPNTTEVFTLDIKVSKSTTETSYQITFIDKRLDDRYGTIKILRKENNFWRFPDKADNYLIILASEIIFQLLANEVS